MLDCHRVSNVLISSYFMLLNIMNYHWPRWLAMIWPLSDPPQHFTLKYRSIWRFPKMGVPGVPLNHPFIDGLSIINHPFGDILHLWKPSYHHLCSYQEKFLGFPKFEDVCGLLKSSETPSFVVNLITTSTSEPWNFLRIVRRIIPRRSLLSVNYYIIFPDKVWIFNDFHFGLSETWCDIRRYSLHWPFSLGMMDLFPLAFLRLISVDSSVNLRITRRSPIPLHNGRGKTGCNVRLEGFCQNLMIFCDIFWDTSKKSTKELGDSFGIPSGYD